MSTSTKSHPMDDIDTDEAIAQLAAAQKARKEHEKASKALEKAARKRIRKAKLSATGETVGYGVKAVGRALIDTDVRDIGHGVRKVGSWVGSKLPSVEVSRTKSTDEA